MSVQSDISAKLASQFAPEHLEVINESHQHSVPAGSESHFKVVIVSAQFAQQRLIARHQSIYRLLAEELAGPVHALALHTYTPEEWQARQGSAPASPTCMGGSKHDH